MYAFSQGQIFILFLIIGICIGIFFDFFRAFRKIFKTSDFVTHLQDIIFVALVGIFIINNLIVLNDGQIRFYIILAILFGNTFYFLTISKICLIFLQILMKFCKKIVFFPFFLKNIVQKKKDFK